MKYISEIIRSNFSNKINKYVNNLKKYFKNDVEIEINVQSVEIFELWIWKKEDEINKNYIFLGNPKIKKENELEEELLNAIFSELYFNESQHKKYLAEDYYNNLDYELNQDYLNEQGLNEYEKYLQSKKNSQILEEKSFSDIVTNILNDISSNYIDEIKKYFKPEIEIKFELDNLLRSIVVIENQKNTDLILKIFVDDIKLVSNEEMINCFFNSVMNEFKLREEMTFNSFLNETGQAKYNQIKNDYQQKITNL